jgi:cysteine desulfurase
VQRVVRITSGFQQEARLDLAAEKVITQVFHQGWPDPEKINADSRQAALLLNEARNTFAKFLQVRSDEIEFLGEVNLGFHLGISGLLKFGNQLFISEIDKQQIFAVGDSYQNSGGPLNKIPVGKSGEIANFESTSQDVICWQVANGETGIIAKDAPTGSKVFADCTASGVDHLPNFTYDTALFDSRSWYGPAGLGILIVKDGAQWRNPLPHNDYQKSPNSFSIPLALASAVALENYMTKREDNPGYREMVLSSLDAAKISYYTPSAANFLPKYLSLVFADLEADRLVLELEDLGFAVDSGSACKSADMAPSHVLHAMGANTTGNIRITFHLNTTVQQVQELAQAIIATVNKLRTV